MGFPRTLSNASGLEYVLEGDEETGNNDIIFPDDVDPANTEMPVLKLTNLTGAPTAVLPLKGELAYDSAGGAVYVHQGAGAWARLYDSISDAPTLAEVLAEGNTSGASNIEMDASQAVNFATTVKLTSTDANANVNVGANSLQGTQGVLIGTGNFTSSGINSVVIGRSNGNSAGTMSGQNNTIVGQASGIALTTGQENFFGGARAGRSTTTGNRNIVIGSDAGNGAPITTSDNVVIGTNSTINNIRTNTVSIGTRARVNDNGGVSIGVDAGTGPTNATQSSVSIGDRANAGGARSVAISQQATTSGDSSVAIGYLATSGTGIENTVVGTNASITGTNQTAVAIGTNATVTGNSGTALGRNASAVNSATALGGVSVASGTQSTAVGYDADATNTQATALGHQALASGLRGTALGSTSQAVGSRSSVLGYGAISNASASYSVVIGDSSYASATSAIAIGDNSVASASGAIALGSNVNNSVANTVLMAPSSSVRINSTLRVQETIINNRPVSVNISDADFTLSASQVLDNFVSVSGLSANRTVSFPTYATLSASVPNLAEHDSWYFIIENADSTFNILLASNTGITFQPSGTSPKTVGPGQIAHCWIYFLSSSYQVRILSIQSS